MAGNVRIVTHKADLKAALEEQVTKALEACGMLAEDYAADLAPFRFGTLAQSIEHEIDPAEKSVTIGTNVEYAIYQEMGTGDYVAGGSPTPWFYQDEAGEWHMSHGNRPHPFMKPAIANHKAEYIEIIRQTLEG